MPEEEEEEIIEEDEDTEDEELERAEWENQKNDSVVENPLELLKWRDNPDASQKFPDIIKDFPLGNMDKDDMRFCFMAMEFQKQMSMYDIPLSKARRFFQFLPFLRANLSLGKEGFLRKISASSFKEHTIKRENTSNRKMKPGWRYA